MSRQTSGDQLVDAKAILEAIAELKRRGNTAILQELESIELELASHIMEECGLIHASLLKTGAKTKLIRHLNQQIESLALAIMLSLRNAYRRLMEESAEASSQQGNKTSPDHDPQHNASGDASAN